MLLATIFFVLTVLATSYFIADWPQELEPLLAVGDALQRNLGPAWWALVIGVGAVVGMAVAREGRKAIARGPDRWVGYR
jgi:hypothetical protein